MNRIELVLVLIFTFFVIVVWVTSDIILVAPNSPDETKVQSMLEPLNPTFDQDVMKQINERKLNTPIKATPRPNSSNIPSVTETAIEPTPQATPISTISPSSSPSPIGASSPIILEETIQADETPIPSTTP